MNNDPRNIEPGSRVKVFNHTDYIDDKKTPLSVTMQKATVVARYGRVRSSFGFVCLGPYPDLVDVVFDKYPDKISHGHCTDKVELL